MSVDTYLKGKNLRTYRRIEHGDVHLYVSPSLATWAERVQMSVRNWIVRKTVRMEVEHRHTSACGHR